jgi:hypothetical protein
MSQLIRKICPYCLAYFVGYKDETFCGSPACTRAQSEALEIIERRRAAAAEELWQFLFSTIPLDSHP